MSDKIQLLFEGHLSEAIAPGAFKILEPFKLDVDKWYEENIRSGITLYVTTDNVAMFYSTTPEGDSFLVDKNESIGLDKCRCYQTCRGLGFIGGLYVR